MNRIPAPAFRPSSLQRRGSSLGRVAGGFSSVKELRVHARSLFRSAAEVSANPCEEKNHFRKGSERLHSWTD